MEFRVKAAGAPRSVGILAGAYNPVTRAHVALAESALAHLDEVILAMPRELPHKRYEGVSFEDRLRLLERAVQGRDRLSIGIAERGLFIDMARECRAIYGPACETWLICGRDAAERIVAWDYQDAPGIVEQLREYGLLVADRQGTYEPPAPLRASVRRLPMAEDWGEVSATAVRERIARGDRWEHLVPEPLADEIRRLYRPSE
jgi:nicotinate-nucleotide adenylyltransferase